MKLKAFILMFLIAGLALPAKAQMTVCGEAEYASLLRKSPPGAEYMRYPIPPTARVDVEQTLAEGWPRRAFSQTIVYRFPAGTRVADVERFFVEAGVYEAKGSLFRDVNPNRKPGDSMKSKKECLDTLIRCAGGDGNLLFNVGPMPDGRIEPRQVERLKEMGLWLAKKW